MKFAKVLFTLSFLICLLLVPVFPAVSQQAIKPGQTTITYGIPEDANTYIPPPPQIQRRPTQGDTPDAAQSEFIVTYTGFTTEAMAAFQHAVDIWAVFIQTSVPIRISATFENLGDERLLGTAGANYLRRLDGSDVWLVDALADAVNGSDLGSGTADIEANFNSAVNWYYGTDGNTPSGQMDFATVVLHEIGHGLGFTSGARISEDMEGRLKWGEVTSLHHIYDTFVVHGLGEAITVVEDPSAALRLRLTSNYLFWDGAEGKAANGGTRPKLYIPRAWDQGSSYVHLNETTYSGNNPNSLMTPFIRQAEAIHHPGPITLGMFEDMGWTINHAPAFVANTATRSVAENTGAGINIGTPVSATDEDSSDTLAYTLSGTDAASFDIESTTGQLKTKVALNYETKSSYRVTVTADDGALDITIAVTINVTDVNEDPVFATDTTTRSIVENTPANRNIGTPVSATDEDTADTLAYTLSGTDATSFNITSSTGQLKTKAALNYETKSVYSLTVTASDRTASDTIDVTINVTDINEDPVFATNTTRRSIVENTSANQNIGTPVSATDEDDGDTLTYTLSGTDATSFDITSTTGQLRTKAALNYETKKVYRVTVTASDGTASDTISVTINVTDINEAPVFATNTTTRSIAEGTSADENIGAPVSATDEDADDALTYTLGGTNAASFDITSTTGQLKTKAALNYDTQNSYAVTVTATDEGGLPDSISVTINIIDVIAFTDSGLAAAVRSALRIASDAPILADSFATLTRLTASNRNITDLTGLEHAPDGLTRLDLGDNQIVNLGPLANLTHLTHLDIANNLIVNVASLSGLSNLTNLDLDDNQIVNVSSLPSLSSLQTLDLRSNNVGDVTSLSTMTHLSSLFLSGNDNLTNIKQLVKLKDAGTRIDITLPSPVNIPDANLAAALQAAITSVEIGDHIFPEDMAMLITFNASNENINTLTGLETATNLTSLTLSSNQISSLSPLSRLTSLESLALSNTQISSISSLSGLTALTALDLSDNRISSISSLSRLTSLASLDLSENEIVSLSSLSGLNSLTDLDLSDNQITDVSPLSNLTSLETLNLTNNTGITNPGTLSKLKRNGTTIIGIDVPDTVVFGNPNLEAAVKRALRIPTTSAITFDAIETLTQLTATSKQIDDLTGLERATALTRLDLGNNEITDLGPLQSLSSLTTLDLADNQIDDVLLLQNLTSLTDLDLDGNQIQNVSTLPSLTSLQTLDLTYNNVGDVTLLSTMTHLTHLYLRGNANLTNLKQLVKLKNAGTRIDITLPRPVNITDDNLEDAIQIALGFQTDDPIFPEDIETLETLDASSRSITTLTGLEKATDLTTLNLSNNTISSISPLSRLTKLQTLNLSENTISSISSLSGLTVLTSLNLKNNRISSISSLSRLISLTSLDLSDNRISSLSTLAKLTALTSLDLANNRITDVLALQGLSSLRTLDLSGNDDLMMEKAAVLYKLQQVGTAITLPQGITPPTLANIVRFNNAALEAAVRSRLRIRTGYPILTSNITDLTTLTATSKQINDLTGLAGATALTRLDLGNNQIVTLTPLQNLTKLTNLDLADNKIVNLTHLQNLTSLTHLDLDDNEIEDVSGLSNLASLTHLDLRGNDVMDVAPLRNLASLRYIYLNGNENLENLEWLGAIENLRSDVRLPDVVRLPDTNLDAAVRTALSVTGTLPMSEELLESLVTLTASGRNIEDLTGCEYMTELTSLDLRNNLINDVSPLSRLYSLETLMLDRNPILDTSVLRELDRRGTDIDITIYRYPSWDVNQDSDVDEADVFLITATITNESLDVNGDGSVDADDRDAADANKDGIVDTDDLLLVFEKFDRPVNLGAPLLSVGPTGLDWALLEQIDVDGLRVHLGILRAEDDGTVRYDQAIAFLQAILVALQPNQTLLLANYPNPFNPETWIPYQLAQGSDVWITIYDTPGAVVRRLALGYRAEGYYRVRGRAAHWDGRNEVGERVASGIYFYRLETDNVSLLRKMVILK